MVRFVNDLAVGERHGQRRRVLAHRAVANRGGARRACPRPCRRWCIRTWIPRGNIRPVFFDDRLSRRWVMPASTVISRSSADRRTTRAMRVRSIETPPRIALTCASSELPMPNATIGVFVAAQARTIRNFFGCGGKGDRVGDAWRVPRFAVAVMLADRVARGQAVTEVVRAGRQRSSV